MLYGLLWSCNNAHDKINDKGTKQVENFPDGGIKLVRNLDRFGRKQGETKEFYKGGGIKKKFAYENDTLNGECVTFFPNGVEESKGFFWKGIAVGPLYHYKIDGGIRLYNEYDFDGKVYYVQKYNDSGKISREEGVALSPNIFLAGVKDDSLTQGLSANAYFFYAEPKGYENNIKGFFDNKIVPIQYFNSHVGLLQGQSPGQGKHTLRIYSVLRNATGIVVSNDSVIKEIYVR